MHPGQDVTCHVQGKKQDGFEQGQERPWQAAWQRRFGAWQLGAGRRQSQTSSRADEEVQEVIFVILTQKIPSLAARGRLPVLGSERSCGAGSGWGPAASS